MEVEETISKIQDCNKHKRLFKVQAKDEQLSNFTWSDTDTDTVSLLIINKTNRYVLCEIDEKSNDDEVNDNSIDNIISGENVKLESPTRLTQIDEDEDHCASLNKCVKYYYCNDCNKKYTSPHNLQIHMYSHTGSKPFSCKYCGKSFTRAVNLQYHESRHTKVFSHLCSECGRGFNTRQGLQRHTMTSHTGERPMKCDKCDAKFVTPGDLNVHMRSHTGERPYLCSTCGKSFLRVTHLYTHLRIHTGERPFKCTECDRAFTQKGDLKSHERIHKGVKPYVCKICKKRFVQSGALVSHMKTHTGGKLAK